MIKHILFDFDGTLADSGEMGLQILNELLDKYNLKKVSREEMIKINNFPIKDRFKLLGIPFYRFPQILVTTLIKYKELISSLKSFEGIEELLSDLKREGYTLSILSSNSIDNIEFFLNKYNLKAFDNVISEKNIFGKQKSIKAYLKKYDLKNEEIIYIGDELRDIEACKKVNVKIIAVTWGFDSIDLLKKAKPDYLLDKPEKILTIIKSLS